MENVTGASHSLAGLDDYEAARSALAWDIALSPLDLFGLGIGTKANNLRFVLTKQGVGKEAIENIMKGLKSGDKKEAAKAMAEVKRLINLSPEEEAFYASAAKKGVLKGEDGSNAIRLATIENRKDFAKKAAAALDKVNPGVVRDDNRRQIFRTIIEGTNFGVKDPETLALKINQWNESGESLEALAKTYKLAAAIRVANPKLTQEQAIDEALAKQGVDDPAKRKPMTACALGK